MFTNYTWEMAAHRRFLFVLGKRYKGSTSSLQGTYDIYPIKRGIYSLPCVSVVVVRLQRISCIGSKGQTSVASSLYEVL